MGQDLDSIRTILCAPATSAKEADAVTFVAVVRPGQGDKTFSVSLDNHRRWVDMNVADVSTHASTAASRSMASAASWCPSRCRGRGTPACGSTCSRMRWRR